jgi:anaerobic selenocysteine-containing dehydrogenase
MIDIEGDPESPIKEGTLCPKGANTFQLVSNPHRIERVMYRAPYSDRWEQRPLDWACTAVSAVTLSGMIRRIMCGRPVSTSAWIAPGLQDHKPTGLRIARSRRLSRRKPNRV